jgi:hypothetical protein
MPAYFIHGFSESTFLESVWRTARRTYSAIDTLPPGVLLQQPIILRVETETYPFHVTAAKTAPPLPQTPPAHC